MNKGILIFIASLSIIVVGFLVSSQTLKDQIEKNQSDNSSQTNNNQDNGSNENNNIPNDWVSFQDDVAGYSIMHPKNWNTDKMQSYTDESTIESFNSNQVQTGQVPQNEIKVAIKRFRRDAQVPYSSPSEDDILEQKDMTVDGRDAIWREITGLGTNISVEVLNGMEIYLISAYPADSTHIGRFEQMLSTFKFVPSVDITSPLPLSEVSSPLEVEGMAPGTWFFEGSMTVAIENQEGELLGNSTLTTSDDWMTENQVSFEGTIEFDTPVNENITLIISAANPSGLPENEKTLEIPIIFRGNTSAN